MWGVALAIAAVSFGASGGLTLERTTWTEVALMLTGAALVAAALLTRRLSPPLYGGFALLGLTALAAYTGAVDHVVAVARRLVARDQPHVRLRGGASPARWRWCGWCRTAGRAVLSGVGLGCVLVCAWALATKIFPEALAPDETFARLREPFGYWNAVGLMAALGVPPLLWVAARRTGAPVDRRAGVARRSACCSCA